MIKFVIIFIFLFNISFANNDVNYIKIKNQVENLRETIIKHNIDIKYNEKILYGLNKKLEKLKEQKIILTEDLKSNYYASIKLIAHVNAFSQNDNANIFLFPGKAKDALIANSILKSLQPSSKKIINDLISSLEKFEKNKNQILIQINNVKQKLKEYKTKKAQLIMESNSLDALLSSREIFNSNILINQKKIALKKSLKNIQRNSVNMAKYYNQKDTRFDKYFNTTTDEKFSLTNLSYPIVGDYEYDDGGEKTAVITTYNEAILSAPFNGKIIFSGYTKSFGNVIIIQHNEIYSSIITGVSKIYVTVNSWVKKHQPIGIVKPKHRIKYNIFKNNMPVKFKFKN